MHGGWFFRILEEDDGKTVCWGEQGDTFVIRDSVTFSTTLLPLHFKHQNFASFVRQLNKYNFHKVKAASTGDDQAQKYGRDVSSFSMTFLNQFAHHFKPFLKRLGSFNILALGGTGRICLIRLNGNPRRLLHLVPVALIQVAVAVVVLVLVLAAREILQLL